VKASGAALSRGGVAAYPRGRLWSNRRYFDTKLTEKRKNTKASTVGGRKF
jgi:hypothetical protein